MPQSYGFIFISARDFWEKLLKRPNKKRENWLIDIHKSLYHIKQIPQPA